MEIKPETTNLEKILQNYETSYSVPEYQRDYSWRTNEEIEDLWNDILASYRNGSEYFMGTIVLNDEGHKTDQYDIVDGQQRLATFTILFSVIRALGNSFETNAKIFPLVDRNRDNKDLAIKIRDISSHSCPK